MTSACCVQDCEMDELEMVYFLGQCGHESCGLRYPVEIHDGSNYEGRTDLGNTHPGDGVKYAGTGWIQVTGYANHKSFADAIGDPKVMEPGKTYTSEKYSVEHQRPLVEEERDEGHVPSQTAMPQPRHR